MGSSSDDSPDLNLPAVGSCTNLYVSIDLLVGLVESPRLRLNKILPAKILSLLCSYSSLRFLYLLFMGLAILSRVFNWVVLGTRWQYWESRWFCWRDDRKFFYFGGLHNW